MKNSKFTEKFKTNSKFRRNFITITAAALVVVICAVSIPVGLHARNSKAQQLTESSTSPVSETTILSADAEAVSVTEPTTLVAAESESSQTNNKDEQTQNSGSVREDKDASPSKGGSSSSSGPSGNSSSTGNKPSNQSKPSSKPTTTKAPSTTKKTPETTKPSGTSNWTRAQAEAFAAKSRSYGESIGLIWDDSFDLTNSSWQSAVWTSNIWSENELYTKMKDALDYHKNSKKIKYFKIWIEEDEPTDGDWEFTILWMR